MKSRLFCHLTFSFLIVFLLLAGPSYSYPRKIVSLAPNITEILFALGLDREIIGVAEHSNFPARAAKKEPVSGQNINLEKIVRLKPDLILGSGQNNPQQLEKLRSLGFTVIVFKPNSLKEIIGSILEIGRLTGTEKKAREITEDFTAKIKSCASEINSLKSNRLNFFPNTVLLVWPEPFIAAGRGNFLDDLIITAGGQNLAAAAPGQYPELSAEFLISRQPDLIIIPDDINNKFAEAVKFNKNLAQIKAIKEKQILVIDGDILSRPGPRIFEALEIIHQKYRELRK